MDKNKESAKNADGEAVKLSELVSQLEKVSDWIADTALCDPVQGAVFMKNIKNEDRSHITYGQLRELIEISG